MPTDPQTAQQTLRAAALAYPEAYAESPWDSLAIKTRKKSFFFMNKGGDRLSLSLKLKESNVAALQLPFATPTHYGMGRHGWVTSVFEAGSEVPVEMLLEWLDESSRAVAPKTLIKQLGEGRPVPRPMPDAGGLAVLVAGHDTLRTARATEGLRARSATVLGPVDPGGDEFDAVGEADVIVIDLGRKMGEGLDLAMGLAGSGPRGLHIVLTGVRDAKTEARVRDSVPEAEIVSRNPPGDPDLLDALVQAFCGAAGG